MDSRRKAKRLSIIEVNVDVYQDGQRQPCFSALPDYKPFTAFGNVSNHHPRNASLECLWLQTDRLTE